MTHELLQACQSMLCCTTFAIHTVQVRCLVVHVPLLFTPLHVHVEAFEALYQAPGCCACTPAVILDYLEHIFDFLFLAHSCVLLTKYSWVKVLCSKATLAEQNAACERQPGRQCGLPY